MNFPVAQQEQSRFFSLESLSISVPVCSFSPNESTMILRLSLDVLGNVRSWDVQRKYADLCCLHEEMQLLHKSVSFDLPSLPTQEQQGGHFFEHFLKNMIDYCVRVDNNACTEKLLSFFDGKTAPASLSQEYHMQRMSDQVLSTHT